MLRGRERRRPRVRRCVSHLEAQRWWARMLRKSKVRGKSAE